MNPDETRILILRDNARTELLEIKTIEQGMSHLNKLRSIEIWVKAEKKDAELQNIVAEQKLRTQRILGELIKQGQEAGEIAERGDNSRNLKQFTETPTGEESEKRNITDLGISHKQSSAFQRMASIPEEKFEKWIEDSKQKVNDAVNELTTRGALRLAGMYKQSYSEDLRVTGYLNESYARRFREYMHFKSVDQSELVVKCVRGFLDSIPATEQSQMKQAYLSSLKIDISK